MEPLGQMLLGVGIILGALFLIVCLTALMGRANEPKPERRKRHRTRQDIDRISCAYRAGALSAPQAVMRLREIEAPRCAINRTMSVL